MSKLWSGCQCYYVYSTKLLLDEHMRAYRSSWLRIVHCYSCYDSLDVDIFWKKQKRYITFQNILKNFHSTTMFENQAKCLIWIFRFWYFPQFQNVNLTRKVEWDFFYDFQTQWRKCTYVFKVWLSKPFFKGFKKIAHRFTSLHFCSQGEKIPNL